ncbi:MAG TPA: hypothetical protein VME40_19955 [Caulobacteraceae bacterium]|nr:hypothetical protein [Caulobacteraceae bacterium]
MVVLVVLSLLGAVLGALARPRFAAVPIAVGAALAVRWMIGVSGGHAIDNAGASGLELWAFSALSDPADDYLSLLAGAGGASLIAAVLAFIHDRHKPRDVSVSEATRPNRMVRAGRFVRAEGMIEARPVQDKAEQRQKTILGL